MKFRVLGMVAMLFASVAPAIELSQATNDQLLYEVSRRMNGGSGGGGGSATFTCTSNGFLYISVSGTLSTEEKYLNAGGYSQCLEQAADLRQHKSTVNSVIIAAACEGSGFLYKYPLKPDGTFGTVNYINAGGYSQCIEQARMINAG